MDPAQGETQGKSLTSKLKAKVKGVKGKVHLPGQKKRQGNNNDSDSDYSSDESPGKPGPETGYNVGDSTPYTTVSNTPLSPEHPTPHETHSRDFAPTPAPSLKRKNSPSDVFGQADQEPYVSSANEAVPDHGVPPSSPSPPSPGVFEQVKQTVSGAAAAVGSKMGYYNDVDEHTPADPNAPSMMEKTKSALGLDKPADPNAPSLLEKTKASLGLDKPSDPNSPTMIEKAKATLGLSPRSPSSPGSDPGIVTRVSGAVSSLFTGSPKEAGEDLQHTFPAHSDDALRAGDRGVDKKMTASSSPGNATTIN